MDKMRIILVAMMTVFAAESVQAIPAFARRYKISCSTCHAPFPKLKEYGEEFAGAGMVLKEEEKARDYVTAGDELLWLNRDFPVAIRMEAFGVYEPDSKVKTDLQSPWGLKMMSGGALYKNIGYYFYFYMSERGEVAGVEDAYIHFNNVFGSNLDIIAGQFQTSDPLMKRELRLTFEDYMIYKKRAGASHTNLAYDRGIMLLYNINATGTELVGQIVNGNGKEEAGDDLQFDQDAGKNIGLRINQNVFGLFSVGGYYYTGKETLYCDKTACLNGNEVNKITYWGPDFNTILGPLEITAQYLKREDTNPDFNNIGKQTTTGTVLECIFAPRLDKSRVYFTLLYNQIDGEFISDDYETLTFSTTYLIARNMRLTAEYMRDMVLDSNRLVFGVITGF